MGNIALDLGCKMRGAAAGPAAIHEAGLAAGLALVGQSIAGQYDLGLDIDPELAEVGSSRARYLSVLAAVAAEQAARVDEVLAARRFPLTLGGDHSVAIGSISGVARYHQRRGERLGLLWVDAHVDMNTPERSPSGNLHGMVLAILLGHGPPELCRLAGGSPAVAPENVCALGIRDLDAAEAELARTLGVRYYTMSEIDERGMSICVREALERVGQGTAGIHLSLDLDSIDPRWAPGVATPELGGLTVREARLACERAAATGRLVAMDVVEMMPRHDRDRCTAQHAVWLIQHALGKTSLSGL